MLKSVPLLLLTLLPAQAVDLLYETFESGRYGKWTAKGEAFGKAPIVGNRQEGTGLVTGYANRIFASSHENVAEQSGELRSGVFEVQLPYVHFKVGGSGEDEGVAVEFLVGEEVVRRASGPGGRKMVAVRWDVSEFLGKEGRLRMVDGGDGPGFISADHFVFSSRPDYLFPPPVRSAPVDFEGRVATEAIIGLTVPTGSEVEVFATAKEHGLYSPTALSVDEGGRVYVAETHRFRQGVEDNRDRLYWLEDDLASNSVADREAMYLKWEGEKLALKDLTAKSERVRVLVDDDGDGRADRSEVFAEGFDGMLDGTAAGVMALQGRVYFACIPKIWVLRDADGDLVADERRVLQDGFGVRVSISGHDLNGFALGPDGRIYATIGDRGFSFKTEEGLEYHFPNQGAILRFEPDGSAMEVVHVGLRNPKEIAFDQWGTGITVDNNSDQGDGARVVFMMEGADSGWRMGHQVLHSFHETVGMEARPINQWMQERMSEPENEDQPGHVLPPIANFTSGPSGLAYFPGTGYSLGCEDHFLICDYRGSAAASGIQKFQIEPWGASFRMTERGVFAWGVAATDLEWGFDGRLYVSDFMGGWVSHDAGQVFTLGDGVGTPELAELMAGVDFDKRGEQELAGLLGHADQRVRIRAQMALAKKPKALPFFIKATQQRLFPLETLHGVWGLGMLARQKKDLLATDYLVSMLAIEDERIRGQVAKVLGEAPTEGAEVLLPMLADPSERVRALAALAVARKSDSQAIPGIIGLLEDNADASAALRHAGVTALSASADEGYLAFLSGHPSAAVRRAAVLSLRRMRSARVAQFLGDEDARVVADAIRAIHDEQIEAGRPALAALLDAGVLGTETRPITRMNLRRLLHSAYRLGGEEQIERVVRVAGAEHFPLEERREAVRLLSMWSDPPKIDQSLGRYAPLAKRGEKGIRKVLGEKFQVLVGGDRAVLSGAMTLAMQYQLRHESLDSGTLQRVIRDDSLSGDTRARALEFYFETKPERLGETLQDAVKSTNDLLAATALDLGARLKVEDYLGTLQAALGSESSVRRRKAWEIVAGLPGEFAVPLIRDGLNDLIDGKGDRFSDFDLLKAARARKEGAIVKLLERYAESLPTDDPLAEWRPAAFGGDAEEGFRVFYSHGAAQCLRCHQYQVGKHEGGNAGPNLMGVGLEHDAESLLESLIDPSAKVAHGFGAGEFVLRDGSRRSGVIVDEDEDRVFLKDGEKVVGLARERIRDYPKLVSAMPTVVGVLDPEEVRNVVAWLGTLTKPNPEKRVGYEMEELNLAEPGKMVEEGGASESSEVTEISQRQPSKTVSEDAQIDPSVMALGKQMYATCMACHGPTGAGAANIGPPLANSEWVVGPKENLIRMQFRGLKGPIEVAGITYEFPAGMAPMGAGMSNEQLAAVLTYVRNSFGNSASEITPDEVEPYRSEIGQPYLTVEELISPYAEAAQAKVGEVISDLPKAEIPDIGWGVPTAGLLMTVVIVGLSVLGALKMKFTS